MIKPTIVITGANGFIGECLIKHFIDKGWNIKALVHRTPNIKINGVAYITYNIEDKVDQDFFSDTDYLIHCAYLRFEENKNSSILNVNATKDLIAVCKKNKIKQVFLSSFSAHSNALSNYGKTKLECENLYDLTKDIIFKTGLVIGKKGLSSKIINQIRTSLFFPLIGFGNQPIQTINIDDLCTLIEIVLVENHTGLYHVAEETAISMKEFYIEIAKQLQKRIFFIPVPTSFVYVLCKCFEKFGIKLPVSSESVLGLKQLIKLDTKEDLKKLNISLKNYRQSIQSVLQ